MGTETCPSRYSKKRRNGTEEVSQGWCQLPGSHTHTVRVGNPDDLQQVDCGRNLQAGQWLHPSHWSITFIVWNECFWLNVSSTCSTKYSPWMTYSVSIQILVRTLGRQCFHIFYYLSSPPAPFSIVKFALTQFAVNSCTIVMTHAWLVDADAFTDMTQTALGFVNEETCLVYNLPNDCLLLHDIHSVLQQSGIFSECIYIYIYL